MSIKNSQLGIDVRSADPVSELTQQSTINHLKGVVYGATNWINLGSSYTVEVFHTLGTVTHNLGYVPHFELNVSLRNSSPPLNTNTRNRIYETELSPFWNIYLSGYATSTTLVFYIWGYSTDPSNPPYNLSSIQAQFQYTIFADPVF